MTSPDTPAAAAAPRIPEDISDRLAHLDEIAKNARRTFFSLLLATAYCLLTVATTTDAELVLGSRATELPVIGAPISILGFYLVAPALMLAMHLYLHLSLLDFWREVVELPGFPDDTALGRRVYPWFITRSVLRREVRALREDQPPFVRFEWLMSVLLGWWVVPVAIFLCWNRYLVRHDVWVTGFHVAILSLTMASSVALYSIARATLRRTLPLGRRRRSLWRLRIGVTWAAGAGLFAVLSMGSLDGAPESYCATPLPDADANCSGLYAIGRVVGWGVFEPFADLEGIDVSVRDVGWSGHYERLDDEGPLVQGASLLDGDLRHAHAKEAFLVNADLSRADLRWSDLQAAWLQGAKLSEAILRGAKADGASFEKADLAQAQLDAAWLVGARFRGATLENASLEHSRLIESDLSETFAWGANLKRADLRLAKLENADFSRAALDGAELQLASLNGITLEDGSLSGANLDSSDLGCSPFRCSILVGADLTGANLRRADLGEARLFEAILSRADLREADLTGVQASYADFGDANLANADLAAADLVHANLMGADLSDVDLSQVNLSKARLRNARLPKAVLTDAVLVEADLCGAELREAIGLTQEQLAVACGDAATTVPADLVLPLCEGHGHADASTP